MPTETTPAKSNRPAPPKPKLKLCVNCRWFQPYIDKDPDTSARLARCERSVLIANPVTGMETRRFCENERMPGADCGPDARYFLPDNADIAP